MNTALTTAPAETALTIAVPAGTLTVTPATDELVALLVRVRPDVDMAQELEIDSPDMLKEAEGIASRLKHVIDTIEGERAATVKPLNDRVKEINAAYNDPKDQIKGVLDGVKGRMVGYSIEQQRIADDKAAEDRRRREDAARLAAQHEAAARTEANALAEQAMQQQAAGSEIVAGALMQQAATAVDVARTNAQQAVLELHSAPRVAAPVLAKGLRGTWDAEVTDMAALLVHVAEQIKRGDLSLLSLFEVSKSNLKTMAKLQKENLSLPGVRPKFDPKVTVSGKGGAAALAA